jgi:hypothetical protein
MALNCGRVVGIVVNWSPEEESFGRIRGDPFPSVFLAGRNGKVGAGGTAIHGGAFRNG